MIAKHGNENLCLKGRKVNRSINLLLRKCKLENVHN